MKLRLGNGFIFPGCSRSKRPTILNADFGILQNQLYNTGARNFVFINVPPLELTPELRVRSVEAQETIRSNVNLYNSKLLERIRDLKTRLPSVSTLKKFLKIASDMR